MRIYNRQLDKIENVELENKINEIIARLKEFAVQNYGIDSQMVEDRINNLSIVTFSRKDNNTLIKEFDGEKREVPINSSSLAFHGQKSQNIIENKCYFENAIFIDDTYSEIVFEHVFAHEFFHHLSADLEMSFNSDGEATYKSGVSLGVYDKDDNPLSRESQGLNEGITEMLAIEFSNKDRGIYNLPVKIATILNNKNNPYLMNAYFSNDKTKIQDFFDDFNQRQHNTSSEELKAIPSTTQYFPLDVNLLRGCLEYSLSYCVNMEQLRAERKRLLPLFMEMSDDLNIVYSDESFDIKEMVTTMFNERRTQIEVKSTQDLGKETIEEQKDTEYIGEIEQNLNEAERKLDSTKKR